MLVTKFTRNALAYRRMERKLAAKGYISTLRYHNFLLSVTHGKHQFERISDVVVAPNGKSLFVKLERNVNDV